MELNILKFGQANCSIIKNESKLLIYDCGHKDKKWTKFGKFTKDKETLFENILDSVNEIAIIISHNDTDHINLIQPLLELLKDNNFLVESNSVDKIKFIYKKNKNNNYNSDNDNYKAKIEKLTDFFPNYQILAIDSENDQSLTNNDKSLMLKIRGTLYNEKYFSFFFTGDATGKTKTISNEFQSENFYSDILLHIPSSTTFDSLVFTNDVLSLTEYPSLIIISSDPSHNEKIPKMDTIRKLCSMSYKNLERVEMNNKYNDLLYYCIPHNINCHFSNIIVKTNIKTEKIKKGKKVEETIINDINNELIKYPSIEKNFTIPLFVTSDSITYGYKITVDSEYLILTDNIVDETENEKDNQKKIDEPLYAFSLPKVNICLENKNLDKQFVEKGKKEHEEPFNNNNNIITNKIKHFQFKQRLNQAYMPFLAIKNIKEINNAQNFLKLKNKGKGKIQDNSDIENNFIDDFINEKKEAYEKKKREVFINLLLLINTKIFEETQNNILFLDDEGRIDQFISLALNLTLSLEEIKDIFILFKNKINESEKEIIEIIDKIIKMVDEKLREKYKNLTFNHLKLFGNYNITQNERNDKITKETIKMKNKKNKKRQLNDVERKKKRSKKK